jgi:hypothetical protein
MDGVMTAPATALELPRRRDTLPFDIVDIAVNVLLMVFLVYFYVGSRFELAGLPIRVEDLIFLLLLPLGYRYVNRPKSKLFYFIAAYFGINLLPWLADAIGGYTLSIYPVIVMKEVEYLYIAYLVCVNRSRWVLGTVDALALLIIGNGIRSIIAREITYYGIGTFGAYDAPSLAGSIFMFSAIWIHIRSKLLPSRLLRILALGVVMMGGLCAVATISRSTIAALAIYTVVYGLLSNLWLAPWVIAAVVVAPFIIEWASQYVFSTLGFFAAQIINRALQINNAAGVRSNKWAAYLGGLKPLDWVFGRGKGYPNALDQTLGLGVDSQYVRIILENGILGFALLMTIMVMMILEIRRRGGEWEFALATLVAMLMMSVPFEALQVSKPGGFFWLILIYLLMCQRKPRPELAAALHPSFETDPHPRNA